MQKLCDAPKSLVEIAHGGSAISCLGVAAFELPVDNFLHSALNYLGITLEPVTKMCA